MFVICKKATKRLVKGLKYKVTALYNSGKNQRWVEGKIIIENLGRFTVSNFTDVDGNPIPKLDILPPPLRRFEKLNFEDLKVGDILVCVSDSYKTLVKDGMYRIEKLQEKSFSTGSSSYVYKKKSVKFEGVSRQLTFSNWRFRKLNEQELRDISLVSLLEGKEPNVIKTTKIRKIDSSPNKDLELMKNLSRSILDESRHHLSVVDWACQKTGKLWSIDPSDFKDLLNMPLKDILEKIQK